MLPKKYRANKSFFKNFKKTGDFYSEHICLKIAPVDLDHSIFAFIIGAKQIKKAVQRNIVKRRARSIVAKILDKIKPGFCVLLYFKANSDKIKFTDMQEEIVNLFRKAKILK